MKQHSKHKNIGVGFFRAAAILFLIFIIMFFFVDHGYDIGALIHGLFSFFVLLISGVLFLVGITFYWGFKAIRNIFIVIISLALLMFFLQTLYDEFVIKPGEVKQANDKEITKQLVITYEEKIELVKNNEIQIVTLLDKLKSKLENKDINTGIKGSSLAFLVYRKFVHDKFIYLGLFFDDKYFDNEYLEDATFWYDESYDKYQYLFTTQEHYISYFKLLHKKTYSKYDQRSTGLHHGDQEKYVKTVLKKGYMDAYLALVPLLESRAGSEKSLFKRQIKYALALDLKLDKQLATKAFLNKTNHYDTYSKSRCTLFKTVASYSSLKSSVFLHEYMDLIIKQFQMQCSQIDYWGNFHTGKEFKEAICYIKKNPKWFKVIQLDTYNVKGHVLNDEYCSN